jgi:hypothetical protein
LTGWTALIGLQGVAKASVLVLVGAQGGKYGFLAAISKQGGEQVTLDEPGVSPDKILCVLEALIVIHRFSFLMLHCPAGTGSLSQ